MSIEYEAILGIGKEFDTDTDDMVYEFLLAQKFLTVEDRNRFDSDWFNSHAGSGLNMTCQNCFSGDGRFLGVVLDTTSPDQLIKDIPAAIIKWNSYFTEAPTLCNFVWLS